MSLKPINFYPGPSKLDSSIGRYYTEGFESGIFDANHRSHVFEQLMEETKATLKTKLAIPNGYEIILSSSATECWEMIAQSIIGRKSFHLYNGAFGAKWLEYTKRIVPGSEGIDFGVNDLPNIGETYLAKDVDVICVTHNETSNGTQLPIACISELSKRYDDCLVAVDATSSLGGQYLDLSTADIWYASVQKCFGLPPGLAVMILSPKALQAIETRNDQKYYNSLPFVLKNFEKNQTPYTPNIPGIYLLNRVMMERESIALVDKKIQERHDLISDCLEKSGELEFICHRKECRSKTVLALTGMESKITRTKENALKNGILLGNGYGKWKTDSLRIANFPSIDNEELSKLLDILV